MASKNNLFTGAVLIAIGYFLYKEYQKNKAKQNENIRESATNSFEIIEQSKIKENNFSDVLPNNQQNEFEKIKRFPFIVQVETINKNASVSGKKNNQINIC